MFSSPSTNTRCKCSWRVYFSLNPFQNWDFLKWFSLSMFIPKNIWTPLHILRLAVVVYYLILTLRFSGVKAGASFSTNHHRNRWFTNQIVCCSRGWEWDREWEWDQEWEWDREWPWECNPHTRESFSACPYSVWWTALIRYCGCFTVYNNNKKPIFNNFVLLLFLIKSIYFLIIFTHYYSREQSNDMNP